MYDEQSKTNYITILVLIVSRLGRKGLCMLTVDGQGDKQNLEKLTWAAEIFYCVTVYVQYPNEFPPVHANRS